MVNRTEQLALVLMLVLTVVVFGSAIGQSVRELSSRITAPLAAAQVTR